VKLAIIAIVLIDITIAVLWFYDPTYPTAQVIVRPVQMRQLIVGADPMIEPHVPDTARSNYCTFHGHARTETVVRLTYGTPLPDASYNAHRQAQQTLFPNAWNYVHAGCTCYTATQTVVRYCPQCRAEEQRWKREHQ
jgi:hypothetical protein